MANFYLYSILGYYLFLILVITRIIITCDLLNENKQNKSNKDSKTTNIYTYIKIFITSLLPFVNTFLAFYFLYYVICDDDTFKKSAR